MKKIEPDEIYRGLPCSVVAIGTALGITERNKVQMPKGLHEDGYLSLNNMKNYIEKYMNIGMTYRFKKPYRPSLREWVHQNEGKKAVVCCLGHFVYVDGKDYHSFYFNGGDEVVCAWVLEGVKE